MPSLGVMQVAKFVRPRFSRLSTFPHDIDPPTDASLPTALPSDAVTKAAFAISAHGRVGAPPPPILSGVSKVTTTSLCVYWSVSASDLDTYELSYRLCPPIPLWLTPTGPPVVAAQRIVELADPIASKSQEEAEGPWSSVDISDIGEAVLSDLTASSTYTLRLRCRNTAGWSDYTYGQTTTLAKAPVEFEASLSSVVHGVPSGIIFYLGCHTGTTMWENPALTGVVKASRSSSGTGEASAIAARGDAMAATKEEPNAWWTLDFETFWVSPSSYVLWVHSSMAHAAPRSWTLEASQCGVFWTTLVEHKGDLALSKFTLMGTWPIDKKAPQPGYRFLRVRMTGPNAAGGQSLSIAGLEMFGTVTQVADDQLESASLPTIQTGDE
mmetsp:Transcript_53535/g.125895  ORF Transcript_53535/g.125895 Transcript_53535/m.125895 type:complete len:382 (+) Transcript_53535:544-1689(+)